MYLCTLLIELQVIVDLTPKFIYFDLDDTLLDHREAETAALRDLYEHFEQLREIDLQSLVDTYRQVNSELWGRYGEGKIDRSTLQESRFGLTLRRLGIDEPDAMEVDRYYLNACRRYWKWVPGAHEALNDIARHYETGILTNGFTETQRLKFDQFSLQDYARHLIISEEVGYLKPHPEIFQYATARAEKEPEEILYVGDSYSSDIEGGASFGWRTAWFTDEKPGNGESGKRADIMFGDYRKLCALLNVSI